MYDREPPITIVSGLPRSGTSMMMRMLQAGGLELLTDGVRIADVDNPGGYFELEQVKGLRRGGDVGWLREARGKVVKIISPLLRFLPREHRYQVILMRRRMEEILASQGVMLHHRGEEPDPVGEKRLGQIYVEDLRQIEQWMGTQPNLRAIFINYNGLILEPLAELARVEGFLDAGLDLEAMASIVDPELYRQRR